MATFDKVNLASMLAFERATGKNALTTLQAGSHMSALDLQGLIFMVLFTKDKTVTLEKVENMTSSELEAVMSSINAETS